MSPARRRRIRLIAALGAALLLSGALAYTSFTASSQAVGPGTLRHERASGRTYTLTGVVVGGSVRRHGDALEFRVRDRAGSASVPVSYRGAVPEAFRAGREVIVNVRRSATGFVGERDSLVTKCPSKFSAGTAR